MNIPYTKGKLSFLLPILLLLLQRPLAQEFLQHSANDAYAITRMAGKFHVQPRAVNDTFSRDVFDLVLKKLDERKIFFTQQDIAQLQPYRDLLDDEILSSNPRFIQLLSGIYRQRMKQTDSLIDEIAKKPFDFSLKEKYTAAEDTSYTNNITSLRTKLYKLMKLYHRGLSKKSDCGSAKEVHRQHRTHYQGTYCHLHQAFFQDIAG